MPKVPTGAPPPADGCPSTSVCSAGRVHTATAAGILASVLFFFNGSNADSEPLSNRFSGSEPGRPSVVVESIRTNGTPIGTAFPKTIAFPAFTQLVEFRIQPAASKDANGRWRYRLEGIDREWRDAGGWIRIAARFSDENGNVIGGEEQTIRGQSPGWTSDPSHSPFTSNTLRLDVPNQAKQLQVWTCSAGPHATVGMHALRNLTAVLHPANPGDMPVRRLLAFEEGTLLPSPQGTPNGWARHGTSLGFAKITSSQEGAPLFLIQDDSATTFGGWLTTQNNPLPVTNFSAVTLEWQEAFSIGWAGPATVSYSFLPPGNYRLRLQPLTLNGNPSGTETVIPVNVRPPLHQSLWFQGLVVSFGSLGIFWVTRGFARRKHAAKIEAMKREQAVLDERLRIARDLHDSLGADLTHLALLSDLAQRETHRSDPHDHNAIFDAARNLTRRVDEIVWALNPVQDSLPRFIEFVGNHTQKFLSSACMRCRLDLPLDPPALILSSPFRHDLFLIIKELLHNVVKHSRASEVRLRLQLESEILLIAIEDNGCGFPSDFTPGNGTTTLRSRIDRLKGQMQISETEGGGTTVRLRVPLSL